MDHQHLRRLFDLAFEAPVDERAAILERASGGDQSLKTRVLAMLAAAEGSCFLGEPTANAPPRSTTGDADIPTVSTRMADGHSLAGARAGELIGRYKLLQPIGEGGFGTVWMAEQREPVKRRVALKIIKLGMDTRQVVARFEAERQALAMMDHPNIARVLDAGATETGRPYFVMEYIRGVPILAYCDAERLDTRARLRLFVMVCNAIQHAHQKGIVHRDIKPSNVLVTLHDGVPVPKVIDFGIAKATNAELTARTLFTEHRQMVGTPAYMSPEQAEMSGLDIDTRADIYSLGVLLYELLTGTTPFANEELVGKGFAEMMRIIREVVPERPSTRLSALGETAMRTAAQRHMADARGLTLQLRGDLDWIVMKCLEKDRNRRYETANGLAADVVRHLANEPVAARPPSAAYRLRKFVRRNRAGVIAGAALLAVLVLGIVGTSAGMAWAFRERATASASAAAAKTEADRATEIKRLVKEMLGSVTPQVAMGRDTTLMLSILDEATARIEAGEVADELVEAEMRSILGETYAQLSQPLQAEPQLREALEMRRHILGDDHPDTLVSIYTLGRFTGTTGGLDEGEALTRQALEGQRRVLGEDHLDTLSTEILLGFLLRMKGNVPEAEQYVRDGYERLRRTVGPDDKTTLMAAQEMGTLCMVQGRLEEAEAFFREMLAGRQRTLGQDDPGTLVARSFLRVLLERQGRFAEAEAQERLALEGYRRILGNDHERTLVSIAGLARVLHAEGKLDEAVGLQAEALDGQRRVMASDDIRTLRSIDSLAFMLAELGRGEEALSLAEEAIARGQATLPPGRHFHGRALETRGRALLALGRFAEAESDLLEAHTRLTKARGPRDDWTRRVAEGLTALYTAWNVAEPGAGHAAQAATWREEARPPDGAGSDG
ncbi:MAG: serine/threonine protein kinase [Phycisphaerales bacterium]|nr:serine/threonine protein kinase [Phycisphaerales bacterium]